MKYGIFDINTLSWLDLGLMYTHSYKIIIIIV